MWQVRRTGRNHRGFCWGNMRERVLLEGQGVYGRIILKWIIKKWNGIWIGLIWLRIGIHAGSSEAEMKSRVP